MTQEGWGSLLGVQRRDGAANDVVERQLALKHNQDKELILKEEQNYIQPLLNNRNSEERVPHICLFENLHDKGPNTTELVKKAWQRLYLQRFLLRNISQRLLAAYYPKDTIHTYCLCVVHTYCTASVWFSSCAVMQRNHFKVSESTQKTSVLLAVPSLLWKNHGVPAPSEKLRKYSRSHHNQDITLT